MGILCNFPFRGSLSHGAAHRATFVGPALPYAVSISYTWGPFNQNDNCWTKAPWRVRGGIHKVTGVASLALLGFPKVRESPFRSDDI